MDSHLGLNLSIFPSALYNPVLMAETGGIPMLMRNVLYFHQLPRINECLLQSIIYLINQPYSRYCVRNSVDLEVSKML